MFFKSESRVISLDQAGNALVDDKPVPSEAVAKAKSSYKSKVRRLYDIANVLTSLRLIRKIYLVEPRKAAFMWLGADVFPLKSTLSEEAYVTSQEDVPRVLTDKLSQPHKAPRTSSTTALDTAADAPHQKRAKSFLQLSKGMPIAHSFQMPATPSVRSFAFSFQGQKQPHANLHNPTTAFGMSSRPLKPKQSNSSTQVYTPFDTSPRKSSEGFQALDPVQKAANSNSGKNASFSSLIQKRVSPISAETQQKMQRSEDAGAAFQVWGDAAASKIPIVNTSCNQLQ
mmetsp:Transcript_28108/g.54798  ORF Transcript_28108/g.54798 Transcript_28108/m.54798 type:complete len:284 (+) Transcript_28108:660-1511(+)